MLHLGIAQTILALLSVCNLFYNRLAKMKEIANRLVFSEGLLAKMVDFANKS